MKSKNNLTTNKKAMELSLQTIIIFIILVITFIVVIYFFVFHYGNNSNVIIDTGTNTINSVT